MRAILFSGEQAKLLEIALYTAWHYADAKAGGIVKDGGEHKRQANKIYALYEHVRHTPAERIVRARMIWMHWRDFREAGESRRESLSSYDDGSGEYFGSLVSCDEGAIWKAAEMEAALRLAHAALVAAYGEPTLPEPTALESVKGREAILAARKVLAEIDAI